MKRTFYTLGLLSILAFSIWLFLYDDAAEPGPLSPYHEDVQACTACHRPWHGVSDEQCLECHDAPDKTAVRREIRFHEERKNCLVCHREHRMLGTTISRMDHTILNEKLMCSQCHFDRHDGLFGENCRQCHGITSWRVQGYRHPGAGRIDCFKCHKPPGSHYDVRYWSLIVKDMSQESIAPEDCWQCHSIYHWRELKMAHNLSPLMTP